MSSVNINNPEHCQERAAEMRALAEVEVANMPYPRPAQLRLSCQTILNFLMR
jgi:hypothetical protein